MCKNSEKGAKWPILRKSARVPRAGVRNGLRFDFASSPAGGTTAARANRARALGRGP